MNITIRAALENIFWPAAAGNVLWSLSQLWFDPTPPMTEIAMPARLVVLLVFCVYMTVSWLRLKTHNGDVSSRALFFEVLHLAALTATAVIAHVDPNRLVGWLYAYFIITIAGHISDAVPPREENSIVKSFLLIGVNAVGFAILYFSPRLGIVDSWRIPLSFIVALVLWFWVRSGDLREIPAALRVLR